MPRFFVFKLKYNPGTTYYKVIQVLQHKGQVHLYILGFKILFLKAWKEKRQYKWNNQNKPKTKNKNQNNPPNQTTPNIIINNNNKNPKPKQQKLILKADKDQRCVT